MTAAIATIEVEIPQALFTLAATDEENVIASERFDIAQGPFTDDELDGYLVEGNPVELIMGRVMEACADCGRKPAAFILASQMQYSFGPGLRFRNEGNVADLVLEKLGCSERATNAASGLWD